MAILRYEDLNYQDLSGLSRDQTVVLVPSGPLEQHGPHLPLGVDAFSASFFSAQIAERLQAEMQSWNFLLFPTLFAGCDTLTHMGTIEVRQTVIRDLLMDCCSQLAKQGYRKIILVGAHGGPRHMVVLEEVAAKLRWRYRTKAISASSKTLLSILKGAWLPKLEKKLETKGVILSLEQKEALKTDFHDGLIETSMMMRIKPHLVGAAYRDLEPVRLKSIWKLRRNSGKKAGAGLGYLGSPAMAQVEIGDAFIELLLEEMAPLIKKYVLGEISHQKFRSVLYYIPLLRSHFRLMLLLLVNFIAAGLAWMIFMRSVLNGN